MKLLEYGLTVALSVGTTLGMVHAFGRPSPEPIREMVVDRLIVRRELIVSDTQRPWEEGFERQQVPRGIVARSLASEPDGAPGVAGLWVRSRLIKTEIDDPFDDRFHAIHKDGALFRAPGHLSWNVWIDGAWRQMALIQGEGLEENEAPRSSWDGGNHPGRLRFQTFRPQHDEPLTDAVLGQGKMSIGGGGYGGGGLPYPSEVLQLWGGGVQERALAPPSAPRVLHDDGSGERRYALIALGPQGRRSAPSAPALARGRAALAWDSVPGADAYQVVRDGRELPGILRIEGAEKRWTDRR